MNAKIRNVVRATSQYAAIWADKLIAISKQAVDAGDPLPGGGRVVVADAKR